MRIELLNKGKYEPVGSIRYIDGKVVFIENELNSLKGFKRIYWIDKFLTPKNGLDFMNATKDYYSRSYAVSLMKEKEDDTWMK